MVTVGHSDTSLVAPFFGGAAAHPRLPLPLADQTGVFLSNTTLRYPQNPQTDDGGRLFGVFLRLLPEKEEIIKLASPGARAGSAGVCVRTDHSDDLYLFCATLTTD